ncbi:MAG TPA: hypothetical protein VNL91_04165 [Thermoanaerobaculia bacterium]|nr:hypothetical protein [Thermoanaerobaculia bacterium]
MTAPQGADFLLAQRFARSRTVPGETFNIWRKVNSAAGFNGQIEYAENDNFDPSGRRLAGVPVKRMYELTVGARPTIIDMLILRAHHLGRIVSRTLLTAGVYQYELEPRPPRDPEPAGFLDAMDFLHDDGEGIPHKVLLAQLATHEIGIPAGELLTSQENWLALCDTELSQGIADGLNSGSYTATPQIVGRLSDAAIADLPITVEVTDAAGAGFVGKVTVKLGTTVGANKVTITSFGKWYAIKLADLSNPGPNAVDRPYLLFPAGAGTLTIGDKWEFERPMTLPAQSYPDAQVLNAAGVFLTIDGDQQYGGPPGATGFTNMSIRWARPKEAFFSNGALNPQSILRSGVFDVDLTFERPRNDREFFDAMERARLIAAKFDIYGNPLATGYDEQWTIDFPYAQVQSVTRDVTTPNTLTESITVRSVIDASDFTETFIAPFVSLPGFTAP